MAGRQTTNGSRVADPRRSSPPYADLPQTERLEAALREEERRYRTLVETNPVAIWQLDTKGRLVYANQALANLLQFETPESLLGEEYAQFFNSHDLKTVNRERERRIRGESSTYEVTVLGRLGKSTPVLLHGSPLKDENGQVSGVIGCLVDISELAAARSELRRAGERLEAEVAARTRELDQANLQLARRREMLEERVKERTNALREVNARLEEEIRERQLAEAQQRRISDSLRVVLDVADELLACPDEDTLCRRAVELARERLGVERASLFLFDADGETAKGTYGTNLAGRTTKEDSNWFQPLKDWETYERKTVENSPNSHILIGPHYEWDEASGRSLRIGSGEIAVTLIQSAAGPIAIFFNDQARTGLPIDPSHQQAIAVYCQWLGSVIQQQRAKTARTQSDLQFRAVFEHALEPMVLADDHGRILELNRAGEALIGHTTADLRGRVLYDFMLPERERAEDWVDFLQQQAETGEVMIRRAEGTPVTVEYSAIANVTPGKHLAVLRDVTARRRTEQSLAGQRRILEMVARGTPLSEILDSLILLIEEIAGGVRGSIHLCRNDQLHGVSGPNLPAEYNRATAVVPIGDRVGSCGTAAFRRKVIIVKDIARDRLWRDYRHLAIPHGLRACWSSPIFARDGRILGTFALYRDQPGVPDSFERELVEAVTSLAGIAIERAQDEERLRLIESAVHHTHDAVLIATAEAQPRAVYVNPAMASLTGYTLEELYRRRPGLLPGANEKRPLAEALEQGDSIEYSGQVRRKDGSEYSAEWTVSPVRDSNGAISHWVWVERDVTARHRLEDQLRQSQKMDAIGRLAGGVAHDFNNLLAVIGGYSDLLLEESEPGSRQRSGLEEIRKAAERATSLTRQLLAFARRDVVAPRVLDLNAIVMDMESMLHRLIGEHIEMQAILDPNLPAIRVDAGQIEQVIMNLGVNARDAMPAGGRLTWETLAVELDENASAALGLKPGAYVVLSAADTGIGIPDEVLPHIFEPFYTTKERGKGTGLGLATVYAIVVQNKGQIRVSSQPNCGALFEIYFPADKARRPAAAAAADGPEPPAIENLTILLVEDEPQVRRLAAEVLRSRGHTVMEAERGDAALQFAAHYPGDIDLLLADVMMPGMNGREVANRLSRMRPETRVLLMSGYLDDSVLKLGVAADHRSFLQKPFTPDQLVAKVQECMQAAVNPAG